MATGPVLTIHRAADEIGGNCIELEHDGHRLLLDAGSPLVGDGTTEPQGAIPRTLDTSKDIAGLVISHPHQDHWGLLRSLPPSPHAELRIATGSLLGSGLYDPAILTVDEALARFEDCI